MSDPNQEPLELPLSLGLYTPIPYNSTDLQNSLLNSGLPSFSGVPGSSPYNPPPPSVPGSPSYGPPSPSDLGSPSYGPPSPSDDDNQDQALDPFQHPNQLTMLDHTHARSPSQWIDTANLPHGYFGPPGMPRQVISYATNIQFHVPLPPATIYYFGQEPGFNQQAPAPTSHFAPHKRPPPVFAPFDSDIPQAKHQRTQYAVPAIRVQHPTPFQPNQPVQPTSFSHIQSTPSQQEDSTSSPSNSDPFYPFSSTDMFQPEPEPAEQLAADTYDWYHNQLPKYHIDECTGLLMLGGECDAVGCGLQRVTSGLDVNQEDEQALNEAMWMDDEGDELCRFIDNELDELEIESVIHQQQQATASDSGWDEEAEQALNEALSDQEDAEGEEDEGGVQLDTEETEDVVEDEEYDGEDEGGEEGAQDDNDDDDKDEGEQVYHDYQPSEDEYEDPEDSDYQN